MKLAAISVLAGAALAIAGCESLDVRPGSPDEAREYTSRYSVEISYDWRQEAAPLPRGPSPRLLQRMSGPPVAGEPNDLKARMWVLVHQRRIGGPSSACAEALQWLGKERNVRAFVNPQLVSAPSKLDQDAVDEIVAAVQSIAGGPVATCATRIQVSPRGTDAPRDMVPTDVFVDGFSFERRGKTYSILLTDDLSDRRSSVVPILRTWRWGACC